MKQCLIYLLIMNISVWVAGRLFPRKWIRENDFPFCTLPCEKDGKIYEKLSIKKWKNKWPDASRIFHKVFGKAIEKIYPKKSLNGNKKSKISTLIKESCIAEATHKAVSFLGWACLFIDTSWKVALLSFMHSVINLPSIVIQRYNRPRLKRALKALDKPCVETCTI